MTIKQLAIIFEKAKHELSDLQSLKENLDDTYRAGKALTETQYNQIFECIDFNCNTLKQFMNTDAGKELNSKISMDMYEHFARRNN